MAGFVRLISAAFMMLLLCHCTPPTREPIPATWDRVDQADTLLVLLPGIRNSPQEFFDQGFVDEIRNRELPWDVVAVDAHMGYYREQSLLQRLRRDVIRRDSYQHVILAGISLGGFGSMLAYCKDNALADEYWLIAPFLGEDDIITHVRSAGDAKAWLESPETETGKAHERELWRCIGNLTAEASIYLAWGQDDDFATANALLAKQLQPDHSFTVPGGHDWTTWTTLWPIMIDLATPAPANNQPASP